MVKNSEFKEHTHENETETLEVSKGQLYLSQSIITSATKSKNEIKELAKELYIVGFDIFKIAKILNRNEKTIRNYKAKDGDWDKIKANLLTSKIKDKESASLYESFTEQMFCAIENINADEKMNAEKKNRSHCENWR